MSETERIRWWDEAVGGVIISGYAGAVEACLFLIWRPPQGDEWVLTTQLPGMESVRVYGDDPGELKAEAERLLAKFATSLGAVFPESQ